ncbi:MAG: HAD family hydrolase, partial [Desulfatitalea sp.]|nr:HAD family hydrolase [Desulfatitalea sp.]NNK00424.1 HAD family hydrolase [Desulfatitalea sp.]
MLQAILLDLDNTLILFDETAFYLRFMERISPRFASCFSADEFRMRLLRAFRGLLKNPGAVNNRTFFLDRFCQGVEDRRAWIWEQFDTFYSTIYETIPVSVKTPADLMPVLDQLADWGLPLVLATNPLFPPVALVKRLAWAELTPDRFVLLTHLDNMSAVKPRTAYYRQIINMIGAEPETCLMVGNDSVNDLAAGALGLKTFLTTDATRGHT